MRILRVDLTTGKMQDQEISKQGCVKFLGGRGLAAKILYEGNKPRIDAFGPENRLIFMTGPYTGTLGSFTAFYNVTTKSPLTGASFRWTWQSNSSGSPSAARKGRIRRSGFAWPRGLAMC